MSWEFHGAGQKVMQALSAVVLVVAALYFGRAVLLPLALAVLLTFLISPLVTQLERWRLPRVPAVLCVMLSLTLMIGSIAWVIGSQITDLANDLPKYKENLQRKAESMRFAGRAVEKIQKDLQDVSGAKDDRKETHSVRVIDDQLLPFDRLALLTTTVLTPATSIAIIVVLMIFMSIHREDLRNRLVRLAGARLTLTTRTLDDIGTRISRYLLVNACVNGGFGLAVALGLSLIGVEYAPMWGFVAAVLRFLPYVGPISAAVLPITMAFIQFPGHDWHHPAMTAALFVVLELITNNIVEPLVYGHNTGVSTVALLISAVFWTWVWGPMGLLLAVPLTVVLTVLGEHIAPLAPLAILLSDKPALDTFISYYQRLLAADLDEATSLVEEQVKVSPLIEVYDSVLVPALVLAEKDRDAGDLSEASQEFVWQTTRELIDELAPHGDEASPDGQQFAIAPALPGLKARVLGCPAHDAADEMALRMLEQNLVSEGGTFDVLSTTLLASELISRVADEHPDAVCISSLGPVGVRQTRYLCKRLRQAHPDVTIIVGRWGYTGDRDRAAAGLKRRGADQVVTSLAAARNLLHRLTPVNIRKPVETAETAASV